MKWFGGVPKKLFVAGCNSSKEVLLHALWIAVSNSCLCNQDEALGMCLKYLNDAYRLDGKRPRKLTIAWLARLAAMTTERRSTTEGEKRHEVVHRSS